VTRFYHLIPGGHYGWQAPQHAQWWRQPPYFCDVVAPVATLGRGSPTAVVCYRHTQLPEKYRGGFFLFDWTFGRVHFLKLHRSGASYEFQQEVFLESVGDNGFAPTAAVVHPKTGDLYVAIGGRGTRGAVYRIRYRQGGEPVAADVARLQPPAAVLDWRPEMAARLLAGAAAEDALERLRALTAILRHRGQFDDDKVLAVVRGNWDHRDRYVRQATANLIAALGQEEQLALGREEMTPLAETTWCLGTVGVRPDEVLARLARRFPAGVSVEDEPRLTQLRLLQRALGDLTAPALKGVIWEGYTPRKLAVARERRADLLARLRKSFPGGSVAVDNEIARLLALLEDDDPEALDKVAGRIVVRELHGVGPSDPVADVHYLAVLARLTAPRPDHITRHVADALLALDRKVTERRLNRDRHWPLRVAELHAELARKDPKLNAALLAHPEFGRPDHVLFTQCPGFDRPRAAEIFLARAEKDADFGWSAALVDLLGELPDERSGPMLRRLWERGGLEEAILPILARKPQPGDRDKFLLGLQSPQLATLLLCLEALEKLPDGNEPVQLLALVRCLRRLPAGKEEDRVRAKVAAALRQMTGQEKLGTDREAWTAWLGRSHPELAGKLGDADGVDVAGWQKRLAGIDWSAGAAERGRLVFVKTSCAACHSGAQALGPDLHGVTGRFSRDDLFTAILQPSKDVSPRYRTTQVTTAGGKVYQGLIVYEAVDSLILQTGSATTVRVVHTEITERRLTDTSLMPVGLLDRLTDQEIGDLYAYLKSLGGPARRKRRRSARRYFRPAPWG
jgi:putative heme-binding domain-containing protein